MDIISQLQEQANTIASIAFNTFGTLQRDAPPVRLSPNYPEPPNINPNDPAPAPGAPANNNNNNNPQSTTTTTTAAEDATPNIAEQTKLMSADLIKAAKQFDLLVSALPLAEGGEEAQVKRIRELQAENDDIGQELQWQLEAAEKELKLVQELFSQASDNCLNLKKLE